ncbi:MAG TPA: HAMP domain-containing sensor histidine kinase, partial [Candidatus Paceibacterota bacterium]|nr:HAMP domain-containing sensor histidine kinase [Candidatus Paceibacterota bacterium]
VGTTVLVFLLAIASFAEIIFSDSVPLLLFRAGIFLLILVFGASLIRGILREIQQRERIEVLAKDLEAANKQQIALIHFITHQLKGFVAKSRNIFSMLAEGDYGALPQTMKPIIDEGFASATKGAQTIQDILNASNIKSGKTTYQMALFDFKALVDGVVKTLKPNADAKNVAFTVDEPAEPVMITGDQMQLENAIKNLVDNTIKYTPKGSITLTLTNDGTMVHFTTQDTGVGITPEDMQHLFTEGGHGAESQKVNVDSTGFGLYIVKKIIEGHGGTVHAESEGAGKGSKFVVELPVNAPTSTQPAGT